MKQLKPIITAGQSLDELCSEIERRREWTYRTPFTWKGLWLKFRHWWTHRNFVYDPNRHMTDDVRIISKQNVIVLGSRVPSWNGQFKDMRKTDYRLNVITGLDDAKELIQKERNQ